jgi:hypothetical protein
VPTGWTNERTPRLLLLCEARWDDETSSFVEREGSVAESGVESIRSEAAKPTDMWGHGTAGGMVESVCAHSKQSTSVELASRKNVHLRVENK